MSNSSPCPLSSPLAPAVSRWDMTAPTLIFGGLLASAIAICGALDASSPVQQPVLDESRLIQNDGVIGFSPNDPVASCERAGKRCRVRGTASGLQPASFTR